MEPIKMRGDASRYDYWLTDEGILEIKINSPRLLLAIGLLPIIALLGASSLFPNFEPYFYVIALVWGSIIVTLYHRNVDQIRRKLSVMSVEAITNNKGLSTFDAWSDITKLEFHGQSLNFKVAYREHRAKVQKEDLPKAIQLAQSKLGQVVMVRER